MHTRHLSKIQHLLLSLSRSNIAHILVSGPFFLPCKQDPIYVFPEMKLRGLVPNFHIHVFQNCGKIGGPLVGIYKLLTDT
jgi:hypothetical protein